MLRAAALGALLLLCSSASALELAQAGRSTLVIAVESGAAAPERFAAEELHRYLAQITGANLPIESAAKGAAGTILISAASRPLLPPVPVREGDDAYSIVVGADRIELRGATPRAALFAVYGFLEQLGCRWYAPDFSFYRDLGHEEVPTRPTIVLAMGSTASRPSFLYRAKYIEEGKSHSAENLKQLVDWMGKQRCNVLCCPRDFVKSHWDAWRDAVDPEAEKRGIVIQVGGHGYYNYLSPDQYFASHPDWFGMVQGKRTRNLAVVFNTSNPEALATLAAEVVRYLRAHPEIRIFNFWPPDVAQWSEDPASLALGPPEVRHALVLKYVRQAIKDAGLPVIVEAIAYAKCLNYPAGVQIPSDVMIDVCPINRSYEFAADDPACPDNVPYVQAYRQWKQNFSGLLSIYSYYRKYSWASQPVNLPLLLPHEARYYHEQGACGISSYSEPADWFTYEYQHYLLAQLLWDVNRDPRATLLDYCTHRYGAAGAAVADYYLAMEPVVTGCWSIPVTKPKGPAGLAKLLAGAARARQDLTAACQQLAGDAPRLATAQRLAIDLEYADRTLELCRLSVARDRAGFLARLAELRGFLAANAHNGVILLSDYQTGKDGLLRAYSRMLPPTSEAGPPSAH